MRDFKISDDLFVIKEECLEKGQIYFCADSFYGYYTVAEFDEFLVQLVSEFLKIREEIIHGQDN